jgi:hypothetical protein
MDSMSVDDEHSILSLGFSHKHAMCGVKLGNVSHVLWFHEGIIDSNNFNSLENCSSKNQLSDPAVSIDPNLHHL